MDMTLQASTEGTVTMADLGIGKTIDVYNRTFLLHDCDEFTRHYLKIQGGERIDISLPQMEEMTLDNGSEYDAFGVDGNDAQQNSTSLIPKPPKKDFHKLMNNEKKVLRFITGLVEGEGQTLSYADKDRTFILSYFLADDTIAIFEPPARNSGIIGGKFLERCTIKKPGSKQAYKEGDLHVGAVLAVHNRHLAEGGGRVHSPVHGRQQGHLRLLGLLGSGQGTAHRPCGGRGRSHRFVPRGPDRDGQ